MPDEPNVRLRVTMADGSDAPPEIAAMYSSAYTPLPDDDADGLSDRPPSYADRCLFCGSPDWAWALVMVPPPDRSPIAWKPMLAACEACASLYRAGDHQALRQRVLDGDGTDWLDEYFDRIIDNIAAVRIRQQPE
jgi:hypothetical protein